MLLLTVHVDTISEELLDDLLAAYFRRDFEKGHELIQEVLAQRDAIDWQERNSKRFMGRFALWVEAGYSGRRELEELLALFPLAEVKTFHVPLHACLMLAWSVEWYLQGNLKAAADSLELLIRADFLKDPRLKIGARFLLARCWRKSGSYDLAGSEAQNAWEDAMLLNATEMAAVISVILAWIDFQCNRRQEARRRLHEAQLALSSTDDYATLGNIESFLGRLCRRAGLSQEELQHYDRARKWYEMRTGQARSIARVLINRAFGLRVLALKNEQRQEAQLSTARNQAQIARQADELFGAWGSLVRDLSVGDASLQTQFQQPQVRTFVRGLARALAQPGKAAGVAHSTHEIATMREDARISLDLAIAIAEKNDIRATRMAHIVRGCLDLDDLRLEEAHLNARQASTDGGNDPVIDARSSMLLAKIEIARADDLAGDQRTEALNRARAHADHVIRYASATQSDRLRGKAALCMGLCCALLNELEEAHRWLIEAEKYVKPALNDYVSDELGRLRRIVFGPEVRESGFTELLAKVDAGEITLREFHGLCDQIVIVDQFKVMGTVPKVVAKLKTGRNKVQNALKAHGINWKTAASLDSRSKQTDELDCASTSQ